MSPDSMEYMDSVFFLKSGGKKQVWYQATTRNNIGLNPEVFHALLCHNIGSCVGATASLMYVGISAAINRW